MISLAAARAGLAQIITSHATSIKAVYPRAIDNPIIPSPAVILGALVQGEFDQVATACTARHEDKIEFAVAVIVARDGISETGTQSALEAAWVEVLDALRAHIDGPDLAGVGHTRRIARVEPGDYQIAGVEYPAQILYIEFHG